MFYVLISGKRDFENYNQFCKILDESLKDISDDIVIVEGGARGTDALAKHYANTHGIQCQEFPALWAANGRAAGPIRNSEMVKFVSSKDSKAIFFWDGKSKGTDDCLKKAKKAGIVCEVYLVDNGG